MGERLKKTIVLVGMMGAGKTAVGGALSTLLGVDLLDSDAEIVKAANMTIPEIFARDGEAFFRAKESLILDRLLHGTPCVLSTGGGAFLRTENRDMISRNGVSVFLDAPLDVLWARVKGKTTRPLLLTDDPLATLSALYAKRLPIYRQADVIVPSSQGASLVEMAERVATQVRDARPDVLATE